jgi:hypothetical protein
MNPWVDPGPGKLWIGVWEDRSQEGETSESPLHFFWVSFSDN